jgi:hypothetical protein
MTKEEWLALGACVLMIAGWWLTLPALAIIGACVGTGMAIRFFADEL